MTASDLVKIGPQEQICGGPPMFQTLFPSRFAVELREWSADGSINLQVAQTVLVNPPGVESAVRPAMFAKMNQVVTLRKSGVGWKIASFENKFGSMDSLSSR